MLSQMTMPGRVALSHGVSSPAISSVLHRLMSVLFNYNLEAISVPLCLFWVWSDMLTLLSEYSEYFWLRLAQQTKTYTQSMHCQLNIDKQKASQKNIKIKSMIFYWAQSHWIIKPVCDILKWASYFIIDWQIVTVSE